MLLMNLEDRIETCVTSRNIKYYEDKGYIIPKYYNNIRKKETVKNGTKILVKLKDISKGSGIKIKYQCDNCGIIRETTWNNYNKTNHSGLTYCFRCANFLFESGSNSNFWNNNKTEEDRRKDEELHRLHKELDLMKKRVLMRDNHTCQICKKSNTYVEVHHLDGWNWCFEKRFDDTNCITLCKKCHTNFHSIYGKGNNTKQQFLEWCQNKELNLSIYNGEIPSSRWVYCIEEQKIIKNVRKFNQHIYSCLNGIDMQYKYKHYIWYDVYIAMSDNEVMEYLIYRLKNQIQSKSIICLNNKKIFETNSQAMSWCNGNPIKCIKLNKEYSGYNPITQEPLRWQYLYEYLKDKSLNDYYNLLSVQKEIRVNI